MSPTLRKAVLTLHIGTSIGWFGAVVAYVTLDVTAVSTSEADMARSAYVAMELTALYAIVPLALASVVVGIVNALGTPWGLLRHYWVLAKLALTLLATAVLLVETRTIGHLADAASAGDPRGLPGTLVHSVGALLVLLLITALSVFKPRGLTRYGWRKQGESRRAKAERSSEVLAPQR